MFYHLLEQQVKYSAKRSVWLDLIYPQQNYVLTNVLQHYEWFYQCKSLHNYIYLYKFCMTDVNYDLLMEKVFVNHFKGTSYLSPVNWWNYFINRLETISYGISSNRNRFFTANIIVGIINDLSLSKGVIKSRMTLSINRHGYPALLYFALIALILMSKFDAIFLDLCKSPEMVFRLYLSAILETQGTAFLFFFLRYTCVVTTRYTCVVYCYMQQLRPTNFMILMKQQLKS